MSLKNPTCERFFFGWHHPTEEVLCAKCTKPVTDRYVGPGWEQVPFSFCFFDSQGKAICEDCEPKPGSPYLPDKFGALIQAFRKVREGQQWEREGWVRTIQDIARAKVEEEAAIKEGEQAQREREEAARYAAAQAEVIATLTRQRLAENAADKQRADDLEAEAEKLRAQLPRTKAQ